MFIFENWTKTLNGTKREKMVRNGTVYYKLDEIGKYPQFEIEGILIQVHPQQKINNSYS